MKIIGVAASPRPGQSSFFLLTEALRAAAGVNESITTELIELAGRQINGCLACGACAKKLACSQDDGFPELIDILAAPDVGGLIMATPVYMGGPTAQAKAFLDRMVMFRRNGWMMRNKVGGVIAVGGFRNGGQETAIQSIQAAMLVQDMVVVGDGMPTAHLGGTGCSGMEGGIEADDAGKTTAQGVGKRVAEVALRMLGI
ncbi:MAG: flavodoxin family protein [Desulfarculaceae bacterium]|nr:flavodoxin family protein [Desulfarculaceae bacterium]MCF8072686.1 flavodoxin family protein [Desulfarculaceae bacterium]MCF8102565.1 flavodoxin family protein [Desulfarculaceae bacterium]MCF8116474.1 flavodoxin family protein [Desulfarculaceae bacterium]